MRVVAVADAAVFMAHMPCLIGAERVLDSMGQIVQGHAWGLGALEEARFKGGWGPRGTYQMRQMGIVPTPDGGYVGLVWAMESVTGADALVMQEAATAAMEMVAPVIAAASGVACAPVTE